MWQERRYRQGTGTAFFCARLDGIAVENKRIILECVCRVAIVIASITLGARTDVRKIVVAEIIHRVF